MCLKSELLIIFANYNDLGLHIKSYDLSAVPVVG